MYIVGNVEKDASPHKFIVTSIVCHSAAACSTGTQASPTAPGVVTQHLADQLPKGQPPGVINVLSRTGGTLDTTRDVPPAPKASSMMVNPMVMVSCARVQLSENPMQKGKKPALSQR